MWTQADYVSPFHGENRGSNPRGDANLNAAATHRSNLAMNLTPAWIP